MKEWRTFSADPRSVAAARRFALQVLAGARDDVLEAVELMVSELATNCVRHTGSAFDLSIADDRGQIRVEVTDHAGGTPQMRSPAAHQPSGRGLQIVNMLSTEWGVETETGAGKTVWFTLAPGAARAAAS